MDLVGQDSVVAVEEEDDEEREGDGDGELRERPDLGGVLAGRGSAGCATRAMLTMRRVMVSSGGRLGRGSWTRDGARDGVDGGIYALRTAQFAFLPLSHGAWAA